MERDFTDAITDLDDGKVHAHLTRDLRKLVQAVVDTQKSGALTLKLKLKPDGRVVIVTADVKTTMPQSATGSTFFWPDEQGDLRREDPKQPQLKNLDVRPPTPLKSVKTEPASTTPTDAPKGA